MYQLTTSHFTQPTADFIGYVAKDPMHGRGESVSFTYKVCAYMKFKAIAFITSKLTALRIKI